MWIIVTFGAGVLILLQEDVAKEIFGLVRIVKSSQGSPVKETVYLECNTVAKGWLQLSILGWTLTKKISHTFTALVGNKGKKSILIMCQELFY